MDFTRQTVKNPLLIDILTRLIFYFVEVAIKNKSMCFLDLTPRYSVKEGIAQLRYITNILAVYSPLDTFLTVLIVLYCTMYNCTNIHLGYNKKNILLYLLASNYHLKLSIFREFFFRLSL
jgi:hypothetical protein